MVLTVLAIEENSTKVSSPVPSSASRCCAPITFADITAATSLGVIDDSGLVRLTSPAKW